MNSKKKCRQCKKYKPSKEMLNLNSGNYCDIECATKYAFKNKEKGKKIKHKAQEKKLKTDDLRHQHKLTQQAFNKLRKLQEFKWFKDRGLEPECISCAKKNMDWCCGHFKTVGSHGALRYDKNNTFLQCNRYCNKGLSGNISGNKTTRGYIEGLHERFGDEDARRIIDYCETNTLPKKWTGQELIEMRKKFNVEIRKLEKELV